MTEPCLGTVAVSYGEHPFAFGYGAYVAIMVYMRFPDQRMVLHGRRILRHQLPEGVCRSGVVVVLYIDIADIPTPQLLSATGNGGNKSHQSTVRGASDRRAVDRIR